MKIEKETFRCDGGTDSVRTSNDVNFELAALMYNIGAMHAGIAVTEPRDNSDVITDFI